MAFLEASACIKLNLLSQFSDAHGNKFLYIRNVV